MNLRDGNWHYWAGYPDSPGDKDNLTCRACPVHLNDWVETLWFDSHGNQETRRHRAADGAWLGVRKGKFDDPVFAFRVVKREPLSLEEMRVLLESVLFVDPKTEKGRELHQAAEKALRED